MKSFLFIGRRCVALVPTAFLCLITLWCVSLVGSTTTSGQTTERQRTTKFDDVVFDIAFSPDGEVLAIARGNADISRKFARIEFWETKTGKLRRVMQGFDGSISSIWFSPDGTTLITSSLEFQTTKIQQKALEYFGDNRAVMKWWDVETGDLKRQETLAEDSMTLFQVLGSPDGRNLVLTELPIRQMSLVASRPYDEWMALAVLFPRANSIVLSSFYRSHVRLLDPDSGEVKYKLDRLRPGALGFSPDGNLLAVANKHEVKLWNTQTGKAVSKLKKLRGYANSLAFSPNGQTLAVVSTRFKREDAGDFVKIIGLSEVKLFEVSSGRLIQTLTDIGAINTLAFSADGRILVMGGVLPPERGDAAGLQLLDLQSGKIKDVQTGADFKENVDLLQVSRDGSLLAFRAGPATVQLVETAGGTVKHTWDADSVGDEVERPSNRFLVSVKRMMAVAFTADGKTIAGENDRGEIRLWDFRTGELKRKQADSPEEPSLVAASADGKSFAESVKEKLLVWSIDSDEKKIVPRSDGQTPTALALSSDGKLIAVGSGTNVTLLSPSGEVVRKLDGQDETATRLIFSNEGHLLAGADDDGTVRIWNVASGQLEKTINTAIEVTALAFSPGGGTLATAGADKIISIWNVGSGASQGRLKKHDAAINALAFSPDGKFLGSGGDDRKIVLWDITAGKSKRTFKGHDQTVTSLAFSADSQLLASGSGNASIVIWEVATGKLNRVLR